ncbi:hypothetical protein [Pandoraea terrae]|uniref:hypothetical protein n=1 Tax=Pandoraea terrae TaxID=1537710 RepID=UPI0012418F40|nr:hypothetical protein [Pandoraea terrae]
MTTDTPAHRAVRPPPTPRLAAGEQTASPTDKLYTELARVFGNQNPQQLFSLVWPGTVLNADPYKLPEGKVGTPDTLVQIAQSVLFDQYYPIAPITQPDGTRVSDRYRQALEAFGPVPNERLLDLQRVIRARLDQKVQVDINGVQTSVTLLEKFSILQERWIEKKQAWAKLKSDEYQRLKTKGDADWWDQYVTWYENNAQGYIDAINASYNRMVADFPLSEFEDALAILDAHDAAALLRAKQDVRNAAIPIPPEVGNFFYSTQAIPGDWGSALKPSTTFTDLLAAPDALQRYQDLCIEQLTQQIFAFNAVLSQIPASADKDAIAQALHDFNSAREAYYTATSDLIKNYTDNTVLAVKTYLQYKQGNDAQKTAGANDLITKLHDQNGGEEKKLVDKPGKPNWQEVAEAVGDAQKKLVDDTGSMVSKGQRLADAATKYLKTGAGAGLREMIEPILTKLNAQLNTLLSSFNNFNASAGRAVVLNGDGLATLAGGTSDTPEFASVADAAINRRWAPITLTVSQSDMAAQSSTSTSFSQTNWNVDLFFGSAGGESTEASQKFAANFMDSESNIQIGMLATKVVIERPWMHPEVFALTRQYFKALDTVVTTPADASLTKDTLLAKALGGEATREIAAANCSRLANATLPGYPVAVLLVKDVTIKLRIKTSATKALQEHSERNVSNGGGFLCFSVSRTEASSADRKSTTSYAMAGDYVFRIPSPQIIGVWNQILPPDQSTFLNSDALERIIKFNVPEQLTRSIAAMRPHREVAPKRGAPPQ